MRILFYVLFFLVSATASAQALVGSLKDIEPTTEDFDNVHVRKVYTDQDVTAFVIWIRTGVKAHYHAEHTENLIVVSGKATLTLGDETFTIKAGDYIHIPKGKVHSVVVTSKKPLKVVSYQSPEFLGKDRIFVEPTKE